MMVKLEGEAYYLSRKTTGSHNSRFKKHKQGNLKKNFRNWFLVKAKEPNGGCISANGGLVYLPKKFIGKRVKFKLEVLE